MKIVVNDIAASSGGAMTVLKEFYECVKQNDTENEWVFLLGDTYLESAEKISIYTFPAIKKSRTKKLLFDFITGKRAIDSLHPDVLFSMQNIITFGLKIPQAVYIHQPLPFQDEKKFSFLKHAEFKSAVYQYLIGSIIKCSAKKSDKIIVQTKWMKEAVCKRCRIDEDKIEHIRPNVKDVGVPQGIAFNQTSFFYPTSQSVYKNNDRLFSASDILTARGLGFDIAVTLKEDAPKSNVQYLGYIPYEEVFRKYAASTLVFPSYIETFGYPLAEARKVGTVILASDCPFSHELLEGYENAYFFPPHNETALADLMEKVIRGEIVKKPVAPTPPEKNSWLEVIDTVLNLVK